MTSELPLAGTPQKRVGPAILGLMFGLLLSMLDNFIVGTALPSIVRDLGGAALLSWVVTAYALMSAVSTPVWGKLGDLLGRKRMFQTSVAVFVLGSVLAAAAPTMSLLIAARALQGVGAGGLAVGAFSVIGELVPPRERGKYQGLTAIVVAAGTIGGPLVGGFVTDGLGWRWAFLINLPLGGSPWAGSPSCSPCPPYAATPTSTGSVSPCSALRSPRSCCSPRGPDRRSRGSRDRASGCSRSACSAPSSSSATNGTPPSRSSR